MGLFNRLFGRNENRAIGGGDLLPSAFGGGFASGYNDSGVPVSESNALAASAVYACCKILAESVAQLPVHVYQRAEGGKDYQHPVARLLAAEPNEFMTAASFREALMLNLCLYGNAYAFIERDATGVPVGLYPLRSDCTRPVREAGQLFYQTRIGSVTSTLTADQVLHVLNFSFDGISGISPIQQARQNIGLSLALERFAAKLFSNGGNVGGILKTPPMNEDALKSFVASWRANYTGLENSFKVAVLPDKYDFQPTTIDPERAQVKDARIHQVLEVARIYRIPPHMLGVLNQASYSSLEVSNMEFYQGAIQPIVTRFEQEANRKLLLEREKPELQVRFNMDAMLRASTKERYDAYAVGILNGFITRADVRANENLPFIAGSDVLLQPLNMAAVGAAPPIASPPTTPPPAAPMAARAVVEEAARRVLTKEAKALTRAAKKHAGKPDELRAWAETWYAAHEPLVARAFAAALTTAGSPTTTAEYAREHCEQSLRAIAAACAAGADAHDLTDEWTDIRPGDIADHLLTKGQMMNENETRDVQLFDAADDLELRLGEGETPNRLVGYAAVFNSLSADLGGFKERLLPGAFKDSVTGGGDIRALVGHDPNQLLGRTSNGTLRMSEDERGLRVEMDLPDTSYGRDIREMIRRGDVKGMSFGFKVRSGGQQFVKGEGGQTIRELRSVDLKEVSVVATPAYDATSVQLRIDPDVVAQVQASTATPELIARRMQLRRAMLA